MAQLVEVQVVSEQGIDLVRQIEHLVSRFARLSSVRDLVKVLAVEGF